jgi:Fe-S-cluster containining protein
VTPLPITEPPDDRSCGDCQVCCEVLEVKPFSTDDGHKVAAAADAPLLTKYWERCQWQCDEGCRIYAHRPSPCAEYHCMWRLGAWGDDARPDRLGILAEGSPNGWLFIVEARKGGVNEPLAQAYLAATMEAPDSPATAIHVLSYGEPPNGPGYWIGGVPENLLEDLAEAREVILQHRAAKRQNQPQP